MVPVLLVLTVLAAAAGDETGQPAPRFRAKTTGGEQFNNESIKGKVVLFEFWTTWCKYCEEEAGLVDDIAKEFSGKGLIVLAVDVLEPDQKVKKYLAEHPRTIPIVLTKDTNLGHVQRAGLSDLCGDRPRGKYCGRTKGIGGRAGLATTAQTGGN